jgi:hypothetical protein
MALGRYANSWPGGPEPAVLVVAEVRMGTLHGHAALARAWSRTAATAEAARTRLETIRAARAGAGGAGAALTPVERQRFDEACRDAELSEVRAQRFEDLADQAAWDGDEHTAGRHSWMAARRESAQLAGQEQHTLLTAALSRTHRSVPC